MLQHAPAPPGLPRAPGLPGLRAGHASTSSPGPEVLFEAMELLPEGIALLHPGGAFLHVNEGFSRILHGAPNGEELRLAVAEFAHSVPSRPLSGAGGKCVHGYAAGVIYVLGSHYRLRGRNVDLSRFGLMRAVVVTVHPGDLDVLPDEVLRERFRLTRKEIRVARLLAEGRSNRGVALALCISPHTARHHTERIMAKLGARSRAEVGPRLRDAGVGGGK